MPEMIKEAITGKKLPLQQIGPVTRMDLIIYAGASGDFNPIHMIDEEAEKAGLPGIIAHGMWTMGNLAKLFSPYIHEGFLHDVTVRFSGMVFLEDIISLQACLADRNEKDLFFETKAVNQHGDVVLKGSAIFRLH